MKLKFVTTYSSPAGSYPAGLVTDDIPPPLAAALFGAHAVVPVDPADMAILEAALAETATLPTPAGRRRGA